VCPARDGSQPCRAKALAWVHPQLSSARDGRQGRGMQRDACQAPRAARRRHTLHRSLRGCVDAARSPPTRAATWRRAPPAAAPGPAARPLPRPRQRPRRLALLLLLGTTRTASRAALPRCRVRRRARAPGRRADARPRAPCRCCCCARHRQHQLRRVRGFVTGRARRPATCPCRSHGHQQARRQQHRRGRCPGRPGPAPCRRRPRQRARLLPRRPRRRSQPRRCRQRRGPLAAPDPCRQCHAHSLTGRPLGHRLTCHHLSCRPCRRLGLPCVWLLLCGCDRGLRSSVSYTAAVVRAVRACVACVHCEHPNHCCLQ
jgi:hypothetical protein